MNYKEELEKLNESLAVLNRKKEYLLRDRGLQRELEFHNRLNELLDSFDCPFELLLEVVVGRADVPMEIRSRVAEIVNMDFEFKQEPGIDVRSAVSEHQGDVRAASENALAWQEKFAHKSLQDWFK